MSIWCDDVIKLLADNIETPSLEDSPCVGDIFEEINDVLVVREKKLYDSDVNCESSELRVIKFVN